MEGAPVGAVKDLEEEGFLSGLGRSVGTDEPSLVVDEGRNLGRSGGDGGDEKEGEVQETEPRVNWASDSPSAEAIQMWLRYSDFSPSMTGVRTT